MSMDRCSICSNTVDTDDCPEAYRAELDHRCVCNRCWEEHDPQLSNDVLSLTYARALAIQMRAEVLVGRTIHSVTIEQLCCSIIKHIEPQSAEATKYGLKFCCGKAERLNQDIAALRNIVQCGMIAGCEAVCKSWNYHFPDDKREPT